MSDLTSTDQLAAEQAGKPILYEPDKQGARALAERLPTFTFIKPRGYASDCLYTDQAAERILGDTGLFIPDVGAHEPFDISSDGNWLLCKCGHQTHVGAGDGLVSESYFDHIGAAQ